MNKTDFVAEISKATGSTKVEAIKHVDAFIKVVRETLAKGGDIRLVGFGTYKVVPRAAKVVRNPQNGEKINVPASKKVRFVAGKELKEAVDN